MPVRNIAPAYCRNFWGFMFTIFFSLGWVSFYSTKTCIDNVKVVIQGDESKIVALSTYVALGFVVYCLLLLDFPRIYLIQQIFRKRVNDAKLVLGVKVVNAGCKFLTTTIFPILCLCMGELFEDEAALWTSIGIIGSIFCLFVRQANPADYGLSDAFFAIWLGVLFNLKGTLGKYVVLAIIVVSMLFSKEFRVEIESHNEVQVR